MVSPPHGGPGYSASQRYYGLWLRLLPYIEEQSLYDMVDQTLYSYDSANNPVRESVVTSYICPTWGGNPTTPVTSQMDYTQGAVTLYQGVSGAVWQTFGISPSLGVSSSSGDMPYNGMFAWGKSIRLADVTDGLSSTLMMGEFVHRDLTTDSPWCDYPGNVRGWFIGSTSGPGAVPTSYCLKVVAQGVPNQQLDRYGGGAPFNHLPFGGEHPGGCNFVLGDGSVRLISGEIDIETYRSMATMNGGETIDTSKAR